MILHATFSSNARRHLTFCCFALRKTRYICARTGRGRSDSTLEYQALRLSPKLIYMISLLLHGTTVVRAKRVLKSYFAHRT